MSYESIKPSAILEDIVGPTLPPAVDYSTLSPSPMPEPKKTVFMSYRLPIPVDPDSEWYKVRFDTLIHWGASLCTGNMRITETPLAGPVEALLIKVEAPGICLHPSAEFLGTVED
jgi:hypothetical protein